MFFPHTLSQDTAPTANMSGDCATPTVLDIVPKQSHQVVHYPSSFLLDTLLDQTQPIKSLKWIEPYLKSLPPSNK